MLHTLVLIAALLLLQIYRLAARLALNTWYAQQQRRAEDWRNVEPPLLASLRRINRAKAIIRQYPPNQGFARGGVINKPHGPLLMCEDHCKGCHQEAMMAKGIVLRRPIMHTCNRQVASQELEQRLSKLESDFELATGLLKKLPAIPKPAACTGIVLCSVEFLSDPDVFSWFTSTFGFIADLTTPSDKLAHRCRLLLYHPLFTAGEVQYEVKALIRENKPIELDSVTPLSNSVHGPRNGETV